MLMGSFLERGLGVINYAWFITWEYDGVVLRLEILENRVFREWNLEFFKVFFDNILNSLIAIIVWKNWTIVNCKPC